MAAIKSSEAIARKWAEVTPQRTGDYTDGIQNPRKDWAQSTLAAEQSYETGVQQSIADKRFGKGVKRSGTQRWQEQALKLGTTRWGQGVTEGEDAFARGFAPIRDAIERTVLPPRFARRDPRNLERVRVMVNAIADAAARARNG